MNEINVEIWDATGNKRTPATLPDDAPVSKIIYVLAERLELPTTGPDGMPLAYKFHHKNSGRQLADHETLGGAGIKENDILRLQPEITAGCSSHSAMSLFVAINPIVISDVVSFLNLNLSQERGGFLLGHRGRPGQKPTVVNIFVPCPEARGTSASLTFRPEDWQLAHEHPSLADDSMEIVGWVHSHPDMSVSMSAQDRFIQQHFFSGEGQFAWIRDPVRDVEAIWCWRSGEIESAVFASRIEAAA